MFIIIYGKLFTSYDIIDVNGARQTGFSLAHGTLYNGLRCSTAKAFLRPASKRKNLHITLQTNAEKILIDPQTKKALGVRMNKLGAIRDIKSTREVVLSAGAIQSPQLLMLSGIGPSEELKKHGIQTVLDLPGVGENLQDHIGMGGGNF